MKENWYSLDPPRHIFLHSIKSINFLCKKCGFKIKNIEYESLDATFRSKLIKKGYTMLNMNKYIYTPFGLIQFIIDKLFAKYLNIIRKGESVKILLEKS